MSQTLQRRITSGRPFYLTTDNADGPINALPFVACAGVFAFLSFELGSRIKGRMAHTPA
jgi:hypothetical protein